MGIFKQMSPNEGFRTLRSAGKKYLIRESRVPGMITIDIKKDDRCVSCRYGFMGNEWVNFNVNPETFKSIITPLDATSCERVHFIQLMQIVLKEFGYGPEDILYPNEKEATRVHMYAQLLIDSDNDILKDIVCPITLCDARDLVEPAFLFGNLYEYKYIAEWVANNGTCPVTNRPASPYNIEKTTIVSRILAAGN